VVALKLLIQLLVQLIDRRAQGQLVADWPQATDHAAGNIGKIGMMPERFAGVDIGQMHFDKGDFSGQQGIPQRHTGVGEGGRVEDDEVDTFLARIVNALDQFVLGIALQGQAVVACISA